MSVRMTMIALLVAAGSGWYWLREQDAGAQPPPPPPPRGGPPPILPPNAPPIQQLGQAIFFDTTLSQPAGQACASCHAPQAGWTFPNSNVNLQLGPVPGAVQGRFGNRKPPTVSYATFSPKGPTFSNTLQAYVGGVFWDGRASTLTAQVPFPLVNPNEMNNVVHNVAAPELVVQKVAAAPYANLFKQVFGKTVFSLPPAQVEPLIYQAVAAFESAPQVSPFSSQYDAWVAGKARLTASQLNGLKLVTGSTTGRPGGPAGTRNAQCFRCHAIPSNPKTGPDLWTTFAYFNTGAPKNPNNPYYVETNATTNPLGYNPLGAAYVDYGLGANLYPSLGLPAGNVGKGSNGKGDYLAINGTFKTPTLRNTDKRPDATFVKAYSHNGFFKSLQLVVHFYNTRNLTTHPGEVIDFTRPNPYAGLSGKPIWPPPEVPSPQTMVNPSGKPGGVGNLGLTPQEEADIVNFLTALSDGFFQP